MKAPEKHRARVLILLNCSLAPAPTAIISYVQAQVKAAQVGITSNINIGQMTAVPLLPLHAAIEAMVKDPTYTHLFFASDDTQCEDDILIKLVDDDKDIISGVYRKRDPNSNELAVWGTPEEPWDKWIKEGKLMERKFASGHSMMIKRKVIETMVKKYPALRYKNETGEINNGLFMPYIDPKIKKIYLDDWAFSERARKLGFKSWVDCSVKLKHRCEVWLGI